MLQGQEMLHLRSKPRFRVRTVSPTGVELTRFIDSTFLPKKVMGMVPVTDSDFIYNYTLYNPNVTQFAVTFNQTLAPTRNIQYQLWFNSTETVNGTDIFGREFLSVFRGLDEAIMAYLTDTKSAEYVVNLKDWPTIPAEQLSDTIVQNLGSVFFFCSVMVIFINVLNQIVMEKEQKLRHGMEVMGLKPIVYWLSHYISISYLIFINALVTSVLGVILNFKAFKETNFGVLLLTFFMFGEAMIMMAFFITTLVYRARAAVLIGILIFIIGLLFESFVFSSGFLGYIWWDQDTTPVRPFLPFLLIDFCADSLESVYLFAILQLWKAVFGYHDVYDR